MFPKTKQHKMKIAVVGTGYVGLVSGACFAQMGNNVTCVDVDTRKIESLKKGEIPIYERELDTLVHRNFNAGRLHFTTDLLTCLDDIELVFTAVGTPPDEDGSADLSYVLEVAHTIGANMHNYIVVVTKSTVPVGTAEKVRHTIQEEQRKRGVEIPFDVASNPEFLKEGSAVKDFMSPDRVVVGVDSDRARDLLARLYRPFMLNNFRVIFTDIVSAEMIKYAANSMLATRISFMNDIANLCDIFGANVEMVRKAIGADSRIGSKFLYPGCGYGGSCFPKDVKALIHTAKAHGYRMRVLEAVDAVNNDQKAVLFRKLGDYYKGDLEGKRIALWGLAFKAETDDMREATSLTTIDLLLKAGCTVRAFDPQAMKECRRRLGDAIEYAENIYDASKDADAIMVLTEWMQFRMPDWGRVKAALRRPLVIDGRNLYIPAEMKERGFDYLSIGRPA